MVRETQLLFMALEKEGLQGGESDKNQVVRHRRIQDPEIQHEPFPLAVLMATMPYYVMG
jgi:hypothetical protein